MSNDRLRHSSMDDADRQIQQALLSAPVPVSAKHRLLERLHSQQTHQSAEAEQSLVQQVAGQYVAVQHVADRGELLSAVSIATSAQAEGTLTTAKAESVTRSRNKTIAITACLTASVLAMVSLFIAAQPYSQDRLVAECTQRLEMQPESSWNNATLSSWTESLNFIRMAGIVRGPTQMLYQSSDELLIGSSVRLWKLEFENQPSLYAVELLDAPNVQGVQRYIQSLNHANQSWSIATIRNDKSVIVFFTKGNLDQLMQFSPLA